MKVRSRLETGADNTINAQSKSKNGSGYGGSLTIPKKWAARRRKGEGVLPQSSCI